MHVNVNGNPLFDTRRFFDLAAGEGAATRFEAFVARLPKGWHVWYTGVHPGRVGAPVRVDCFVEDALKRAYAEDPSLFERDVRAAGMQAASPALLDLAKPILNSPFGLELQFDVMEDGSTGPTVGISAAFTFGSATHVRQLFEDGNDIARLMCAIEGLGLADERWRHIADASFTTAVNLKGESLVLYCVPTFVKLRLRDGAPLDAKVYLQAASPLCK